MRCWRVDDDGTRYVGWLIGQQLTRCDSEWKYLWSNFPLNMALEKMVEYTHRRYWVEQFHEEAKGLLGWDQYQGRLWHGFHRHAVLIVLTYSFLVWLELREWEQTPLRGRPRGIFPPRRDRRRQSLAAIPRQTVKRLLSAALYEFIRLHHFLI